MDTKEIIFDLMDDYTKGVDTYNHNGSTWLIFTDEKRWVIELTKEGTLWYNYYFFRDCFKYVSLDVVENQHYITEWVENTIQNGVKSTSFIYRSGGVGVENTIQNGVKSTEREVLNYYHSVENTIQNGVKSTKGEYYKEIQKVEYTIENGVKDTQDGFSLHDYKVDEIIQDGVKNTEKRNLVVTREIEDTIQNGIKETQKGGFNQHYEMFGAIENGVKHTQGSIFDNPTTVKNTIQNGVKKTYSDKIPHEYDWSDQFTEEIGNVIKNGVIDTIGDRASYRTKVESIIQHSIKETKSVSNNLVDALRHGGPTTYADDYTQDFWVDVVVEKGIKETKDALSNRLPNPIENVLENGIKKTKPMDDWVNSERIIENTIKNGIKNTKSEVATREWKASEVINNGIKETNPHFLEIINPMNFESNIQEMKRLNEVNDTIQNGVKEVKELPDQSGELKGYSNYYHVQEDRTKPHTEYVNDVIRDGIKETVTGSDRRMLVENVLNNGVKLT